MKSRNLLLLSYILHLGLLSFLIYNSFTKEYFILRNIMLAFIGILVIFETFLLLIQNKPKKK